MFQGAQISYIYILENSRTLYRPVNFVETNILYIQAKNEEILSNETL